ncbi:MAG: tetratricopeptide repeat protein [Myxococcota bacterium]|jgi:tetratricopeptide (TPR) repeat protein|nr:tetratricopeptide repeat protein [Myxococcota bacterium]
MRALIPTVFVMVFAFATVSSHAEGKDPLSALASQAKDTAEWNRLGDLYLEAARFADAKKAYRKALERSPRDEGAQLGMARIEIARNNFDMAKAACRKLESGHKGSSVGSICSAKLWLFSNRSARAIEELDRAIASGDMARGKAGLGEVFALRGELDQAIKAFDEAIQAGAGYEADIGIGLVKEKMGDKNGAVAALERAAAREPGSCLAHMHLGRLIATGQGAIDELNAALDIRPLWQPALLSLGEALLAGGDAAAAETPLRKAASGDENIGPANYALGRALEAQGKHEEAVAALESAIQAVPNHVGAYLLVADILYRGGKTEQAIAAMERARTIAPGEVSVYLRSGDLYKRLGRHTSARAFLLQAVSMNKNLSAAHSMLGEIACSRHLYDEGKGHYQLALSGDLVSVDKTDLFAKIKSCQGKR